jgi:rSAM/selenodomain-associated transferase 2/rSAM/selenodomain-associated transferase 1
VFRYSVIIPTFNEESIIRESLSHLTRLEKNIEIIIADGGSTDRTIEYAAKYFVKIIQSERGRGMQLNEGAKAATGDILIFLHADTKLPKDAFSLIHDKFSTSSEDISTFRLKFDTKNIATGLYSYFSRFDSLFTTFGDQAILIRKNFYDELNGFSDYKMFEDVEFFQRVRKNTKIRKIKSYVETSARRFSQIGFVKTQLLNLWYLTRYLFTKNIDAIYENYYMRNKFENEKAVIVFVKYPVTGKVKTRLAKSTGEEFAMAFYEECVKHTFKQLSELKNNNIDVFVFFDGTDDKAKFRNWINTDYNLLPQAGKELGERIINAFKKVFDYGYKQVAIIGSDIPDLGSNFINDALEKLSTNDFVLSPSPDGGYNLIGMKELNENIFINISWSTDKVIEETITKINSSGSSFTIVKTLLDIDTEQDLIQWLKSESNSELKEIIEKLYTRELTK